MENQKIDTKLLTARKSTRNNLGKLLVQRKSAQNIPQLIKLQNAKINPLHMERQSPIDFLQNIQQNHIQIQKKLQQAHITNSKWRSYNSPIQTPRNKNKQNIFLQTVYSKRKQLNAIKIYNHIHNKQQIQTKNFQQPAYIEFIQEAVAKSFSKNNNQNLISNSKTKKLTKINNLTKQFSLPKHNYTISDHRKELQELQKWIKNKVQSYQSNQTQGQTMFMERINFLNMAFCQASRIAGTFSTQTKNVIDYLYKKYYDYYNFLIQCMMEQNKSIKAEISVIQDRLCKTINYYEQKIKKLKTQSQQRSQKIIQNFHKCIQIKKKLQKESKQSKKNLSHQRKKIKLMQQGLIKVINLFLALGHKNIQEMTFTLDDLQLNNQNSFTSSMLAKSKKHILSDQQREMERRKQIFQQWCGYLIKMIHRIIVKDVINKEKLTFANSTFQSQAFSIIQKYMVQNDDSLSMVDAEKILGNFLKSEQAQKKLKQQLSNSNTNQKHKKSKQLKDLQLMNRKFEDMYQQVAYQLPTFQEVYNKISVNDVQVQAQIKKDAQNRANQTHISTEQIGIMAAPKNKSRQIDVSSDLKERINLSSCIYSLTQILKGKQQKPLRKTQKNIQKQKNNIFYQTNIKQDNQINQSKQNYNKVNDNSLIKIQLEKQINLKNQKLSLQKLKNRFQNRSIIQSDELIEIVNIQGNSQEIGINTKVTNVHGKKKTVQFNIPQINKENLDCQEKFNDIKRNFDQNQNENKVQQKQQSYFPDQIKQQNSDDEIEECKYSENRPFTRGKRKNGFIITGDRKKTYLSQKFIRDQSQTSIISINSIDSQQESQKISLHSPIAQKKQSLANEQSSIEKNRVSLEDSSTYKQSQPLRKSNPQTFQQKVAFNRSFFNLATIEYATKQQADVHRIKDHVIRVPKKKTIRQKCLIDTYDFHLQLAFKNQQKIKFLSSITLWNPRLTFQMRKIKHRVKNIKSLPEINTKTMNLMKGYFSSILNPILKDFLKCYAQELNNNKFDFGDSFLNSSFKGFKQFAIQKQLTQSNGGQKSKNSLNSLTYYHRLSPLLYNVINFTHYNQNKTSTDNQICFSGMKALRNQNAKMEIYNLLLESGCIQLDVFIKSVYHFNLTISSNLTFDPEISFFIIQPTLNQVLEGYFTSSQISRIAAQIKSFIIAFNCVGTSPTLSRKTSSKNDWRRESLRNQNHSKSLNADSKIQFFEMLKILYSNLKQKQQLQQKKYAIIGEIISRNYECTYYQDVLHFLQCLPIQNNKKKRILNSCLKYSIYWNKSQAMIPNDILYFILDKNQLYSSNITNQSTSIIKQYIINRCELYFKATLQKVTKNPEWVINSTYILSYRIPKVFHRLLHQIKTGRNVRNKKLLLCLLTQIFCNLIDNQMDKRFIPTLFNGLIAIPSI